MSKRIAGGVVGAMKTVTTYARARRTYAAKVQANHGSMRALHSMRTGGRRRRDSHGKFA